MRADGFMGNRDRGYDCLAVIMVLIAYIFVSGIGGFASSSSGHALQETVHLPNASGNSGDARFPKHRADENTPGHSSGVIWQVPDPTIAAPPPFEGKSPVAANVLAQFINLVLDCFFGARVSGPPLETQTVAAANPEWWLRTVVLHL